MIKTIISPANPIIKHVVTLHSAKYRAELQEFIAEGFRTISTIIKAGHPSSAKASDFAPLSPRLQSAGKASEDKSFQLGSPSILRQAQDER